MLVIGAGIIGIAVAYSIKTHSPDTRVTLLDAGPPTGWTSAQSGENYRSWWPQAIMKRFVEHGIELISSGRADDESARGVSTSGVDVLRDASLVRRHFPTSREGHTASSSLSMRSERTPRRASPAARSESIARTRLQVQ